MSRDYIIKAAVHPCQAAGNKKYIDPVKAIVQITKIKKTSSLRAGPSKYILWYVSMYITQLIY